MLPWYSIHHPDLNSDSIMAAWVYSTIYGLSSIIMNTWTQWIIHIANGSGFLLTIVFTESMWNILNYASCIIDDLLLLRALYNVLIHLCYLLALKIGIEPLDCEYLCLCVQTHPAIFALRTSVEHTLNSWVDRRQHHTGKLQISFCTQLSSKLSIESLVTGDRL